MRSATWLPPLAVFALLLAAIEALVAHGGAPMTIPRPSDVARLLWTEHATLAQKQALFDFGIKPASQQLDRRALGEVAIHTLA